MKFFKALKALEKGEKIKRPHWAGYWLLEDGVLNMYCKDGSIIDIRDTDDIIYTLSNIAAEDWIICESDYDFEIIIGMRFGEAIRKLLLGHKLARRGWNGKDMFIYLQEGSTILPENANNKVLKQMSESIKINPHIDIKSADGSIGIGWTPSQQDIFADDWYIVE